jgi:hypothetical protein
MLKLKFRYKTETKTCYRFETGTMPDIMTVYLKKSAVDAAGIDPKKGVVLTIEQDIDNG